MTTIETKNEATFLSENQKLQKEMFEKMCNSILANYNRLANTNVTYRFKEYDSRQKSQIALTALFDKLDHIIFNLYSPESIIGFLTRIVTKPVKVISKPQYKEQPEIYGLGHFRWDWKAYTLNDTELQSIRIYLGLHVKGEGIKSINLTKVEFDKDKFMSIDNHEEKSQYFLKATGTTFNSEYKKHDFYFPDDKDTRDIYIVTLRNKLHRYRFTFGQSIANTGTHPTACDVLSSLQKYNPGTFENFCSDFGYDVDSRKAYKTYKAVMKKWKNVELLFSSEQIEMLQEIN